MKSIEIKHIIAERLTHIDDLDFLNALRTLVETKISNGLYVLDDLEKERLLTGRLQLKSRHTVSNDDFLDELDSWFNSK